MASGCVLCGKNKKRGQPTAQAIINGSMQNVHAACFDLETMPMSVAEEKWDYRTMRLKVKKMISLTESYWQSIEEYRAYEHRERRKHLMSIFRSTLTTLSKIKPTNIDVNATIAITRDNSIRITTFDKNGDNCTLCLYDFHETERSQKNLDRLIAAIKTDDFTQVQAAVKAAE